MYRGSCRQEQRHKHGRHSLCRCPRRVCPSRWSATRRLFVPSCPARPSRTRIPLQPILTSLICRGVGYPESRPRAGFRSGWAGVSARGGGSGPVPGRGGGAAAEPVGGGVRAAAGPGGRGRERGAAWGGGRTGPARSGGSARALGSGSRMPPRGPGRRCAAPGPAGGAGKGFGSLGCGADGERSGPRTRGCSLAIAATVGQAPHQGGIHAASFAARTGSPQSHGRVKEVVGQAAGHRPPTAAARHRPRPGPGAAASRLGAPGMASSRAGQRPAPGHVTSADGE